MRGRKKQRGNREEGEGRRGRRRGGAKEGERKYNLPFLGFPPYLKIQSQPAWCPSQPLPMPMGPADRKANANPSVSWHGTPEGKHGRAKGSCCGRPASYHHCLASFLSSYAEWEQ